MYRPPARELCLDVLESIWQDSKGILWIDQTALIVLLVDEVKVPAGKILAKWRPHFIEKSELALNFTSTIEPITQA